jgi:hypothetical protein
MIDPTSFGRSMNPRRNAIGWSDWGFWGLASGNSVSLITLR